MFVGNRVIATVLAVVLGTAAWAAENPLKQAEVGDWVLLKTRATSGMMAGQELGSVKMILAAKDGNQATVVAEVAMGPMTQRTKQTIDLAEDYDPIAMMGQAQAQGAKKTGEGEETVAVLGKEYECNWLSFSMEDPAGQAMGEMKMWLTPELMCGFAKMEVNITEGPMAMTLETIVAETGKGEKVTDLDKIDEAPKPPAAE